jgi:hypothetical protein
METPSEQAGPRGVSPWLTTAAAAEYLGCTPGTLKTWRERGRDTTAGTGSSATTWPTWTLSEPKS